MVRTGCSGFVDGGPCGEALGLGGEQLITAWATVEPLQAHLQLQGPALGGDFIWGPGRCGGFYLHPPKSAMVLQGRRKPGGQDEVESPLPA